MIFIFLMGSNRTHYPNLLLISCLGIYFASCFALAQSDLKCLVCQQVVQTITSAVKNEDPRKTIQVGSFRIRPDGSQKKSEIKYAGSELHINEILETVCDAMEDYAQAKHKETGEIALLNLSKDVELLSTYELVPDPDLNRGLKYYCENFIEDYEDSILDVYKKFPGEDSEENVVELCQTATGYCKEISAPHDHKEL